MLYDDVVEFSLKGPILSRRRLLTEFNEACEVHKTKPTAARSLEIDSSDDRNSE